MTAVQAPPARRRQRGLISRLREAHAALARPDESASTLLSGHRVRLRFAQSTAWGAVMALAGVCLVAGGYFALLQQRWYIHITDIHFWFVNITDFNHGASLKLWWDNGCGFIHSSAWYLYRHALRDLGEPAVAGMGVRTLLAGRKYWDVRISALRLAATPVIVLALAAGLILGGTWLIYFGMPDAWAHAASAAGHPGFTLGRQFSALGRLSAETIALGILIGQVLHRTWAPAGATLQGFILDRSVDRAQAVNLGRIPLWEKLPIAPPVLRERFAKMWRENGAVGETGGTHRKVLTAVIVVMVLLIILGALAKYPIAHGVRIPYINPS